MTDLEYYVEQNDKIISSCSKILEDNYNASKQDIDTLEDYISRDENVPRKLNSNLTKYGSFLGSFPDTIKCMTVLPEDIDNLSNNLLHGTVHNWEDDSKPKNNVFFLTPDLKYAIMMSKDSYNNINIVRQYRIKEDLELFNILDEDERENLFEYFPELRKTWDDHYDNTVNKDKEDLLKSTSHIIERTPKLIDAIYNIEYNGKKYDGWFAKELQQNDEIDNVLVPQIVLFNRSFDKLKFIKTLNKYETRITNANTIFEGYNIHYYKPKEYSRPHNKEYIKQKYKVR